MIITPSTALTQEQRLIKIYRSEYEVFEPLDPKRRISIEALDKFYEKMQYYFEVYCYHDDEQQNFLSAAKRVYFKNGSLLYLLQFCHLSTYIFFQEDDDHAKLIGLFKKYVLVIRPKVQSLVKQYLIDEASNTIPF